MEGGGTRIAVLGATRVLRGVDAVTLGAAKQRRLLATLALHLGRPVAVGDLTAALWDGRPPPAATITLQGYVADLRRLLEPERARGEPARVLRTDGQRYLLDLPRQDVDATAFADAVRAALTAARQIPDPLHPQVVGDPDPVARSLVALEGALETWDGEPFADLGDAADAVAERLRLQELRVSAQEHVALFRLAFGRHEDALADLEALAAEHPLRERTWALLALALYRVDRQADALLALQRVREALAGDLGVDPAPATRALYEAILRQESSLGPAPRPPAAWGARRVPLLGREAELAQLLALVDDVRAGRGGRVAILRGEAGVGKTRLAAAVAEAAAARGLVVARAEAAPAPGAPPLWSLRKAFAALARATGTAGPEPGETPGDASGDSPGSVTAERGSFEVREQLRSALARAGAASPVLMVLEDLDGADLATLQAVRHLVHGLGDLRAMLLLTRRGGTFEAFERSGLRPLLARTGLVLDLAGLPAGDVAQLARDAGGSQLNDEASLALWRRTGGNPFFVMMLARSGDPLGSLLPGPLLDVLERKLAELPSDGLAPLRLAALLGGPFDAAVVAAASDADPEQVLDGLDAAVAAGIVLELDDGALDFAHPLLREAMVALTPGGARARLHAGIARALERGAGSDAAARARAARHWRHAGPAFAAQAWRATTRAADAAHAVFAHEEEAALLARALASQRLDPRASSADRFALLERQAVALRWAGRPEAAVAALGEALAVAEEADDRELVLRAVRARGRGVVWDGSRYGRPDIGVVAALTRLVGRLGEEETPLRALTLASLACESYYLEPPHQLDAWCAEALGLADRLGDPDLVADVRGRVLGARWRPDAAVQRHALAVALVADARRSGDVRQRALAGTWHLLAETELGHLDAARALRRPVRALVDDNHLSSLSPVLDLYDASWAVLRGEQAAAQEALARVTDLAREAASPHLGAAVASATVFAAALGGDTDAVLRAFGEPDDVEPPLHLARAGLLLRAGEAERAGRLYGVHGPDLGRPSYLGLLNGAFSAELALAFGDQEGARAALAYLTPYAGRPVSAGSAGYLGPVDAFLALAARALDRVPDAAAHAERALVLCQAWGIPVVADWLLGWRERAGF